MASGSTGSTSGNDEPNVKIGSKGGTMAVAFIYFLNGGEHLSKKPLVFKVRVHA